MYTLMIGVIGNLEEVLPVSYFVVICALRAPENTDRVRKLEICALSSVTP
jgi:hypothetical protein